MDALAATQGFWFNWSGISRHWSLFQSPQAILVHSQSWEPLLWCQRAGLPPVFVSVHPGGHEHDGVSLHPHPPTPGLTTRETRMYFPSSQFAAASQHTRMHTLIHTCTCAYVHTHSSAFYYALVTSSFYSGLSSFSKLLWREKPARNERKNKANIWRSCPAVTEEEGWRVSVSKG